MRFTVRVKPNSRANQVVGWNNEITVTIKIAAPAQDGRANTELIRFLAKQLDLARTTIDIPKGTTTRTKIIDTPLPLETVRDRLRANT